MHLRGKKILVLGLGDTGLSMARWLARQDAVVSVADTRAMPPGARQLADELPQVCVRTGAFQRADFTQAEMIAVSPGIDPRTGELAAALRRGMPVVGDIELFAWALRERRDTDKDRSDTKVLAITGSNGKSTVTQMCGDICVSAGLVTEVAGNIGQPVLDVMCDIEDGRRMPDVFVLELSSFQLETTASLEPDAATLLNLSEDHMDRYDSFSDYGAAKARIFTGMEKKAGMQVLNRDDGFSLSLRRDGLRLTTFGLSAPLSADEWGLTGAREALALAHGDDSLMRVSELPLAGLHNAANALAASALCAAIGIAHEPIARALRAFKGLPHRVEKINKINEIEFYDDSKGTNVGATVAALSGMQQPVVLIAGGDGKGQNFSPLSDVVRHARAVVLIGRDAGLIARALEHTGVAQLRAGDMVEAVEVAYRAAKPGDAVLLSPACASYDMFRSYVHRAAVFTEAVAQLARRAG